tara:strand:+ start:1708 stop:1887 length:180 start_codon:yes stop_codon:yes gene_type:complete
MTKLRKFTQKEFEHIIDMLILYKTVSPPETEVYLNEKSIMEAFVFMNNQGKQFADKLGI